MKLFTLTDKGTGAIVYRYHAEEEANEPWMAAHDVTVEDISGQRAAEEATHKRAQEMPAYADLLDAIIARETGDPKPMQAIVARVLAARAKYPLPEVVRHA
jgi:hypothetical protein